jgi:hypothetical protein
MKYNIDDRINKYIGKIEPIEEGKRNRTIHRLGLRLRSIFGLTGDALTKVLCEINLAKCSVPLPESEVTRICSSVDTSQTPIGEPSTTYTKQQCKKASTPKHWNVYTLQCENENSFVDTVDADTRPVFFENCDPSGNGNSGNIGGDVDFSCDIIEVASDDPESPVSLMSSPTGIAKFIREVLGKTPGMCAFSFDDDIVSYYKGDRKSAMEFLKEFGFTMKDDGRLRLANSSQ